MRGWLVGRRGARGGGGRGSSLCCRFLVGTAQDTPRKSPRFRHSRFLRMCQCGNERKRVSIYSIQVCNIFPPPSPTEPHTTHQTICLHPRLFRSRQLPVLVAPLLRDGVLLLLGVGDVAARLNNTTQHHAAEAVLEQVALGLEGAERVAQLVGEDDFEGGFHNTIDRISVEVNGL